MSLPPLGVTVNQVTPQQSSAPPPPNTRTVAVLSRFAQGPALGHITPDQIFPVYGDPSSAAANGYPGARLMATVAGQTSTNKQFGLSLIGVRPGFGWNGSTPVGYAYSSLTAFSVIGVGAFTGSRGNWLQVQVTASPVQISRLQQGGLGTNEVQQVVFYGLGGSPSYSLFPSFSFSGNSPTAMSALTQATTAAGLQTFLNGIVGSNNVTVTALPSPTTGAYAYRVEFTGTTVAGKYQPLLVQTASPVIAGGTGYTPVQTLSVVDTGGVANTVRFQISAGQYDLSTPQKLVAQINRLNPQYGASSVIYAYGLSGGTSAVQTVTISGTPTGGTFQLSFNNQWTGAIAYNATAASVQQALQQLASIGAGNVTVTGSAGGPYTVTFGGLLAAQPVATLGYNGAGLTGGTNPGVSAAVSTAGSAGGAFPSAGTYSLANGTDGAGITPANDPYGTIAYQLGQLASGVLGDWHEIVSEYDAAQALASIDTCVATALQNQIYTTAWLGVQEGTSKATMLGGYQAANSDRVIFFGNDSLAGSNPTNPALLGSIPGPFIAAAAAGLKAISAPQLNLAFQGLVGVGNAPPVDAGTGAYLTPADIQSLQNAGFAMMAYDTTSGRVLIQNLISTAVQTDQYGYPNKFAYVSERDCFDMIARSLLSGFKQVLGTAASTPAQVVAQMQIKAQQFMDASLGTLHNGATAQVTFDPVYNVVTINVGYDDRAPLTTIVINLSPIAQAPAASGLTA